MNYGEIIEVSGYKARCRNLEDGSETDWMPVVYPLAGENRVHWPPPVVGARVVYLEYGDVSGAILGAFYDEQNEAPAAAETVTIELFGMTITITSAGVKAGGTTEPTIKGNTLKTALENFITALKSHTHATAGTGTPSPPDPAALLAFDAFTSALPGSLATKVQVE